MKAEEALEKNKENQVQILLSIGLSLNAEEPRLMAAQARLFARQGDWLHANALYHKLADKPEAADKKSPDKTDRLPDLYLEREFRHAEKMWLAGRIPRDLPVGRCNPPV